MKPVDHASELIPASEALKHAEKQLKRPGYGKSVLEEWLREGRLSAVATAWVREHDFGRVSSAVPESEGDLVQSIIRPTGGRYVDIMPGFFMQPGTSLFDPELWKWESDIFVFVEPPPADNEVRRGTAARVAAAMAARGPRGKLLPL